MFFAENCQVRRSHLVDFEKQLSPILVGKCHIIWFSKIFIYSPRPTGAVLAPPLWEISGGAGVSEGGRLLKKLCQ